jgi:hypothetical protein
MIVTKHPTPSMKRKFPRFRQRIPFFVEGQKFAGYGAENERQKSMSAAHSGVK